MSEEEAIGICKNIIRAINGDTCYFNYSKEQDKEAIETLLEMYHKQKEENKKDIEGYSKMINSLEEQLAHKTKEIKELNLENQAFYEEMNCNDNEYISKKYSQLKSVVEILANGIRVLGTNPDITTEEIIKEFTEKPISEEYMKKFESSCISKDKVLKALGYDENGEEYKRIYNKEELILSLIRTINEECDRLEDIEDQKTMLEIHNIENQRDKYWQDKIRKRLEKLKDKEQELSDEQGYWGGSELQAKIEELEELLEEQL